MLVLSQKDLVSALRQLHSKRPPPDQVQGFLVAVLNGDEPPAVTPVAKGDDEGVYEYFKAHGVFALLKVRSQHAPALRLVKRFSLLLRCPACVAVRGQAPAGRRQGLPGQLSWGVRVELVNNHLQ